MKLVDENSMVFSIGLARKKGLSDILEHLK
jgi:hypothetical protein